MKFLRNFLLFFFSITTGILIVCSITYEIYDASALPSDLLKNILISGAATALPTAVIYMTESDSKKDFVLGVTVHYIILCVIMSFLGVKFGWIDPDVEGIIFMLLCVAAVYAITYFINFLAIKKEADAINKAIREKYDKT